METGCCLWLRQLFCIVLSNENDHYHKHYFMALFSIRLIKWLWAEKTSKMAVTAVPHRPSGWVEKAVKASQRKQKVCYWANLFSRMDASWESSSTTFNSWLLEVFHPGIWEFNHNYVFHSYFSFIPNIFEAYHGFKIDFLPPRQPPVFIHCITV